MRPQIAVYQRVIGRMAVRPYTRSLGQACRIRLGRSLSHEVTRVRSALLTDVGEPFEGNGDTKEGLGVVLDTHDCGRGFE